VCVCICVCVCVCMCVCIYVYVCVRPRIICEMLNICLYVSRDITLVMIDLCLAQVVLLPARITLM